MALWINFLLILKRISQGFHMAIDQELSRPISNWFRMEFLKVSIWKVTRSLHIKISIPHCFEKEIPKTSIVIVTRSFPNHFSIDFWMNSLSFANGKWPGLYISFFNWFWKELHEGFHRDSDQKLSRPIPIDFQIYFEGFHMASDYGSFSTKRPKRLRAFGNFQEKDQKG